MVKVALIGAGSAEFAQKMVTDILAIDGLDEGTFALVDVDTQRLELSHEVAEHLVRTSGKSWTVQATSERRSVLAGCDYVINMIEVGGLANVGHDYQIPLKYGVEQVIADTAGPGGIFKYLRTAPAWLAICRDIEELAPHALVMNYSNPMSAMTLTALRATSLQVVGLCNAIYVSAYQLADYAGVPYERMRYRVAGINHLAWFMDVTMDGEPLYPRVLRAAEDPEVYALDPVRFEMLRQFGAFPTEQSEHISEYVPYFRKRREVIEHYTQIYPEFAGGTRSQSWPRERAEHHERMRDYLARERQGEIAFYRDRGMDYASYIIEGHALNRPQVIYGNVHNLGGLIENLSPDSCVELACLVDHNGIQPARFGRLPTQLAALDLPLIQMHDLMVDGLLHEDREALVHALMLDPLTAAVCTPEEIRQMFAELAETEKEYLPRFVQQERGL